MYRATFAIVDEQAIYQNVQLIHSYLSPETRLLIAIKANGYGHGALQVRQVAKAAGADWFGLATLEEALELRRAGVNDPLLVFGALTPKSAKIAAEHQISITWTDIMGEVEYLPEFPKTLHVHLKLDSGMNRLGFKRISDVLPIIKRLQRRNDILIEGIYTHLAAADDEDDFHARTQIQRFNEMLTELQSAGIEIPIVHAANSAGALQHENWNFHMVRVGISAYGYAPNPQFPVTLPLVPAMHLYSVITRLASIKPGETVGYGATYVAKKAMRIATVPIGYADGYPRILGNQATVLIHGQRAPVVGRVCMDQLMVDVTAIDGIRLGDVVTLFGQDAPSAWHLTQFEARSDEACREWICQTFVAKKEKIAQAKAENLKKNILSLDELAMFAHTISYELLCAISPRVPRIYVPYTP